MILLEANSRTKDGFLIEKNILHFLRKYDIFIKIVNTNVFIRMKKDENVGGTTDECQDRRFRKE